MASGNLSRYNNLASYISNMESRLAQAERVSSRVGDIAVSAVNETHLAGKVVFDDNIIQSSNYVSGTAGWIIDGSGNAEFGSVFVRGNINADSGTIGVWNLSSQEISRTFEVNTATITNITSDGTYLTVTATNSFYAGEYVTITGVVSQDNTGATAGLNFNVSQGEIYSASNTSFTVISTVQDTYTSGGTATKVYSGTFIENVDLGFDDSNGIGTNGSYVGLYTSANLLTSGLYIKDYGKVNFDYGFFSNKGIHYSSPYSLNAVKNPSFEYLSTSTNPSSAVATNSSWVGVSNTFAISLAASASPSATYNSTGKFLGAVNWTTANSGYISAKIDYAALNYFSIFSTNQTLNLGFDLYWNQYNFGTSAFVYNTQATISSIAITNTAVLTVTTAANHGFTTGDYVFMDCVYVQNSGFGEDYIEPGSFYSQPFDTGNLFQVISGTPASTTFTIQNTQGSTTAATLGGNRKVAKRIYRPAMDMSNINIRFPNNSTVSLLSVLTAESITDWTNDPNNYKYKYYQGSVGDASVVTYNPNPLTFTIGKNPKISGTKLRSAYQTSDATNYALGADFYIDFPTWLYYQVPSTNNTFSLTSTNKVSSTTTVGYFIENVYLSTVNNFFYAGSSTTGGYYWWNTPNILSGTSFSSADYSSVSAPHDWIDLNVNTGSFKLNYVDIITFDSNSRTKLLYSPYINSDGTYLSKDSETYSTEVTNFSSAYSSTTISDTFITGGTNQYVGINSASNAVYVTTTTGTNYTTSTYGSGLLNQVYRSYLLLDGTRDNYKNDSAFMGLKNPGEGSVTAQIEATSQDGSTVVSPTSAWAIFNANTNKYGSARNANAVFQVKSTDTTGNAWYSYLKTNTNETAGGTYAQIVAREYNTNTGSTVSDAYVTVYSNNTVTINGNTKVTGTFDTTGVNTFVGNTSITTGFLDVSGSYLRCLDSYSRNATGGRTLLVTSTGAFGTSVSSRRFKQQIEPLTDSLDVNKILQIEPVSYKYNSEVEEQGESAKRAVGFIAEDLDDLGLSGWVHYENDGITPHSVNYSYYVVALQAVVRSQQEQINSLTARLDKLESK